ncbi:MAG: SDR family oxidoreductase [Nitrospinae bacterium]|nr:SDR family oxidoreductase [Nitrospinota bacterium]
MRRALITGAAGFIGSHLAERLIADGLAITGVDNFVSGARENVEALAGPRFAFHERDVSGGLEWVEGPLDYVLHLASPASPPDYLKYPIETLLVGSAGTHAALELAARTGAVFLLASTSEIYGDPERHPQNESYWGNVNSIGPRSCYDEAKRYAEAATMAYRRARGVNTRIVRIFNTYGPRMRVEDGRAVTNFAAQALRGEDITIYGDGSQTRSFCFVSDLVEGLVRLIRSEVEEPVNLGNPAEMTILEMAKIVIELSGSSSKIIHKPLPVDDPRRRRPDISRAREKLGWEPKVEFREGLRRTIDYYLAAGKI